MGPPKHYTHVLYTSSLRQIAITKSGRRQILPPQPHIEDEIDTTEYQVERFGAQSPWQQTQICGLLEHRDPLMTTTTTSSDGVMDYHVFIPIPIFLPLHLLLLPRHLLKHRYCISL